MIYKIFSVYDKKVGAFMTPFFSRSKGEAVRSFTDACSDGQHQFVKHPEDYVLMALGEYDDQTGSIIAVDSADPVMSALECVSIDK